MRVIIVTAGLRNTSCARMAGKGCVEAFGVADPALRFLLTAIGLTAIATGIYVVAAGSAGVTGSGVASASIDSELRFFAVFWIGYGVAALALARRSARDPALIRALALVMFTGGVARAIAWVDVGRPHALFVVLMTMELRIPLGIIGLQGGSSQAGSSASRLR